MDTKSGFRSVRKLAEQRIADRLVEIVDSMIDMAIAGNKECAMYLTNRILGKPVSRTEGSLGMGGEIKIVEFLSAPPREYPDGPIQDFPPK